MTNAAAKSFNVQTVIDIALDEVGYLEKSKSAYQKNKNVLNMKEDGAGSDNYTKYGRDLHDVFPGKILFPAAWCDCFVDWCFYKAYGKANVQGLLAGDVCAYTKGSALLYQNKNAWYTSDPRPGDQIFFKENGGICHTGLVIKVESGYVYTVEGNTSRADGLVKNGGCVRQKRYGLSDSYIAGYGRPRYDGAVEADVESTDAIDEWKNMVMELQKALNTESGAHLTVNGIADKELLMATPTLNARIRSTRPQSVKALQRMLTYWGYKCLVDGDFYNATEKMVKSFQKEKVGLANPDGEFTAQRRSWKVLLKLQRSL